MYYIKREHERAKTKTQLVVDIFEMHNLYRNGCQKNTCKRKGRNS